MTFSTTYLSLYLLMVLLGATSCLSQQPIITLTANSIYAYEGNSLKLTCQVENLDGLLVGWFFKETQIRSNTNPEKYEVTTNGSLSKLTILNLICQDAGGYSCGVYLNPEVQGTLERETLEIHVYYFPDEMYPMCKGPVIITEGEPVTFQCESEPGELPVDLAWRRDSGTIQESIRTGEQNGKRYANYTFLPRQDDNGMTAYCTISSHAIFGGKTSNCSVGPLSVQYSPTNISLTNQNVWYNNSTFDAILCNASAFPTDISYTWSFNTFLDSSQQTLINGNQTLVILNVTICEFPIIATCHASNDIGNTAANYTLCEPPPPPNPVCYPKNQVVLTEGVPEMFQCVSYSYDGNPTGVVWRRDKGPISADSVTTGDLTNNYKYSNYTFVPMRDDNGINVTCSLPGGRIDSNYCIIGPLLIQYIPSDAAISNETYSQENMTYNAFSCKSSALPSDVSYSWSFNTPLSASQHMLTNDNQTLVILNITTCETIIIATCLATNIIGKYSVNVTLCEPPPPPPSPTHLAMTTVNLKPILTSNGLVTAGLPIATTDQATTTPQPVPPLPLPLIIILLVSLFLIVLSIGVFCYIAQTSCCSGQMDVNETDKESGNVQLTWDSRILNDATTGGSSLNTQDDVPVDSAMDNPVFDMDTALNQQEPNIPQKQLRWFESSFCPYEEIGIKMNPNNPREGLVQTQDSSNNTDLENDNNPVSGPENEDEGSQGKDQSNSNQEQDKNCDKPATDAEAVDDENVTDDDNQGNNQPDENNDPEKPSSEPKNEEDQAEDKEIIDEDDIKDDEKMVDPAIIEVETDLNPDDPRKSMVHEALLATQVNFLDNLAKRGFKRKPEMEL